MRRALWGEAVFLAFVLGVGLFSLLVGMHGLALWGKPWGWTLLVLWFVAATAVATLKLRRRARALPQKN